MGEPKNPPPMPPAPGGCPSPTRENTVNDLEDIIYRTLLARRRNQCWCKEYKSPCNECQAFADGIEAAIGEMNTPLRPPEQRFSPANPGRRRSFWAGRPVHGERPSEHHYWTCGRAGVPCSLTHPHDDPLCGWTHERDCLPSGPPGGGRG